MSCLRAVNPLFWLTVASSARAARSAGRARPAGMPAAAAIVIGTGSVRNRNNENSFLPKSR
ncbi:hypothetical protein D1006_23420 [Burkholderia stabilis]|uniref:Uncharacterized protein n=1 Tax=Burkholderia stabilis TaxID=95485 RepID=A0A4Q2AEG0_9BURK|nr:hypothetical protein D1006_23420 [Burkholderia stabilis]